nr:MAG TPA: protein of unknown function DUF2513 [Caudoviricetes sp.]
MDVEFFEVFGDDSVVTFTGADIEQHRDMLQEAAFEGYIVARESELGKCFALTDKGMEYIALLQEQQAAKAISDVIGKPSGVMQQQNYPALFRNTNTNEIILAVNPYMGTVIDCDVDVGTRVKEDIGKIITTKIPFHEDAAWICFNHIISIDSRSGVVRKITID